jgi:antitoxin component YwqK of YwqJK toxin-antitoxin module
VKPVSRLNQYFEIGRYYISKRLIFTFTALILILLAVYGLWIAPWLKSTFLIPTFSVSSPKVMDYAGKIKLVNTNRRLLYEGDFRQGAANGYGTLYDLDGRLTYVGQFINSRYSGEGQLFYPNGNLEFRGGFQDNAYHGQGVLYDPQGNLIYEGGFLRGRFHGAGNEYYPEGPIKFKGYFENHHYQGEGQLWGPDGQLVYTGIFDAGLYNGPGRLYEESRLRYQGDFHNNFYQGNGVLFNDQGAILCQGIFSAGRPDYGSMLELDTPTLREFFPNPSKSIILDDYFVMAQTELQSAFILTYGTLESESFVYEIAFWGDPEGWVDEEALESPIYEGYAAIGQRQRAILSFLDIPAPEDRLYMKQYLTETGYVNLFYSNPQEAFLYLSLGGSYAN